MEILSIVKQSESYDFTFDLDNPRESKSGWVCTATLREFPDDSPIIDRVIPLNDSTNLWSSFLTTTETDTLAIGLYYLTGTKVKAGTGEEQQDNIRIFISERWVTAVPTDNTYFFQDGTEYTFQDGTAYDFQ